jgi:acetyl esterase/lipase
MRGPLMLRFFIPALVTGCVASAGPGKNNDGGTSPEPSRETTPVRDLVFAERSNVALKADWHPAWSSRLSRDGKNPVCVVIHGGGWYKGDKKDMESISGRLARRGIPSLNINYRLAPQFRFPAPVHDTKDAIRWVKANAGALGVDPRRICLFGYSAGAHLALMAGFTSPRDGLDDTTPPSAKIFKFGSDNQVIRKIPGDLGVRVLVAGGTPSDLTGGNYNEYYEKFFGQPPSEIPDTYRLASPVTFVRRGLPPVFLYHGNHDWIVDVEQSRRLATKLKANGVDTEYLEVTLGHVATFLFDDKEVDAALRFVESRMSS